MLANKLTDYVDEISRLETAYDVFRYARRLGNDFGASRFSILTLDKQTSAISDLGVVNNWDPELIAVYDENGLSKASPVLGHFETGNRVMTYDMDTMLQERAPESAALARELFNDFDMKYGACCPVNDGKGNRGGLVFSGNELVLNPDDGAMLHLLSNYLYDHLVQISATSVTRSEMPSLSGREMDCLSHAALGKTSKETARDLELSDHTVTHYLALACKKLEAVNRVHAVAKALRLGLLS
ncbi:autoinducer binding domain-containing protein [Ahrensia sp. R2A130]|uniref:autoinducer binding domain-containing protein n=1 Tax=Ahrensia sp. R2A130 TaxID=744979 RepID=UPI0001E0D887|nr:autoinducer binding domain-containing protein [Ahrensia sp. R2A130]EFL87924.1 transcriptional activator protein ahyr/asar [Ahrensia sp. R2A130]